MSLKTQNLEASAIFVSNTVQKCMHAGNDVYVTPKFSLFTPRLPRQNITHMHIWSMIVIVAVAV